MRQACFVSSRYGDKEPAMRFEVLNLKRVSLEYVRRALLKIIQSSRIIADKFLFTLVKFV